MNTVFFIKEEDGKYVRFEETHEQKAHSAVNLRMLLEKAGFTDISLYGGDSGESEGPGGERMYFCARKP